MTTRARGCVSRLLHAGPRLLKGTRTRTGRLAPPATSDAEAPSEDDEGRACAPLGVAEAWAAPSRIPKEDESAAGSSAAARAAAGLPEVFLALSSSEVGSPAWPV